MDYLMWILPVIYVTRCNVNYSVLKSCEFDWENCSDENILNGAAIIVGQWQTA